MAQVRFGGSEPRAGELGHSQSVETGGVRGPHTLPAGEAPAGSVCRERAWDGVARASDALQNAGDASRSGATPAAPA